LPSPLNANGERSISFYNIHTKSTLTVVYKRNGRYLPEALKKLNWHLRDWRSDEPTDMDPDVIDLVWKIHQELGSRQPVHVISAYRSPTTNKMLRKTRGGQAKRSQHLLGRAIDVRFPDVPVRRLRYSALLRQQGGVGYYPTSATPFVHVDTGRVRHWPRMGREELALLFPDGRTQHQPSEGGPITPADALAARRTRPDLAQRVAAFHVYRHNGGSRTQLASAGSGWSGRNDRQLPATSDRLERSAAARPRLVQGPRVAYARPAADSVQSHVGSPQVGAGGWGAVLRRAPDRDVSGNGRRPQSYQDNGPRHTDPQPLPFRAAVAEISPNDRDRLFKLASTSGGGSMPPALPEVRSPSPQEWISAPAFDDEHPEELFYRPFPIAPYITDTASADDPALRHMTHPDIEKTLTLLEEDRAEEPPMQFRPGMLVASLMWSQAFKGNVGGWSAAARPDPRPRPLLGQRRVRIADGR
jgi:uncharacterized protein YcbK (DUF882 family)